VFSIFHASHTPVLKTNIKFFKTETNKIAYRQYNTDSIDISTQYSILFSTSSHRYININTTVAQLNSTYLQRLPQQRPLFRVLSEESLLAAGCRDPSEMEEEQRLLLTLQMQENITQSSSRSAHDQVNYGSV